MAMHLAPGRPAGLAAPPLDAAIVVVECVGRTVWMLAERAAPAELAVPAVRTAQRPMVVKDHMYDSKIIDIKFHAAVNGRCVARRARVVRCILFV